MITKKTIKYRNKFSLFSIIQQILSVLIGILFLLGLFSLSYDDIGGLLLFFLIVQGVISLIRFNLGAFMYELFLVFLALLSFIPILGFIFGLIGFFASFLDLAIHKNSTVVKQINIVRRSNNNFKQTSSKSSNREPKGKVYEAEYKEK